MKKRLFFYISYYNYFYIFVVTVSGITAREFYIYYVLRYSEKSVSI